MFYKKKFLVFQSKLSSYLAVADIQANFYKFLNAFILTNHDNEKKKINKLTLLW